MKLLKLSVLLLVVALVVFAGVLPRFRNASQLKAEALAETNRDPIVNVVPLRQAADTTGLTLPGQIQPFRQTPLFARTEGFLKRWYVDIGASVELGQLLATIDAPELDQDIARARADRQLAQTNLDRLESVRLPGAIATQDIDTRRSEVTVTQANLGRLLALKALQEIRAPFSGIITSRTAQNGAIVTPGAGEPLFTLSEQGTLRVFVDVPQTYFRFIKVGTPATVIVPELKRTLLGRVVRTSGALQSTSRTLLAEVSIPNANQAIPSGLYSQVKFAVVSANVPVLVPANALLITPEGPRVVVAEPTGRIRFTPIALGRDYGTTIEATSGLTGQERVVTNPNDRLRDGQVVRFRQANVARVTTPKTNINP